MQASKSIIEFISNEEGFYANSYHDKIDPDGVFTIGYGTVQYPNGHMVQANELCSKEQAIQWMLFESDTKAETITAMLLHNSINLNQNRFDSLISFSYEEGLTALFTSTLWKKIKENQEDPSIFHYIKDSPVNSCEFLKWVYSNHKVVNGIVNRRIYEADLYARNI